MGKTYRNLPHSPYRKPHRNNARKGEVRNGAVPPDAWDDIRHSHEINMPYRAAERMLKSGVGETQIIKNLMKKFHLSRKDARWVLRGAKNGIEYQAMATSFSKSREKYKQRLQEARQERSQILKELEEYLTHKYTHQGLNKDSIPVKVEEYMEHYRTLTLDDLLKNQTVRRMRRGR